MIFNSFEFFIFFILVTTLYFVVPHKFRWLLLLTASCYFYMAFVPLYILILFFTIIIDYAAGIMIESAQGERRRWFLIMSIVANVGILAFFKYFNFLADNINLLLHISKSTASIPLLKIILPIGLSFHTFQAMSYTIEVYRGNQKAERHFGIYALYVMFYPQLVAGPIERPQNILHQFHEKHYFNYDDVVRGLRMILWGLFKKVVIADRISTFIEPFYNYPKDYTPFTMLVVVFLFGYEIYCDFSGYSDIALGCARVMGFRLMLNFDRPYSAKSIAEFWRRWHISLSTWFRDYVYIPLGGNKVSRGRQLFNLFLVFLLSGLWHGANWTFIIWGALHGLALIYENVTKDTRKKLFALMPTALSNALSKIFTVSFVMLTWIFFRANNVKDAIYIASGLPKSFAQAFALILHRSLLGKYLKEAPLNSILSCFACIALLECLHFLQKNKTIDEFIGSFSWPLRWGIYLTAVLAILMLGVFNNRQFIYFQF